MNILVLDPETKHENNKTFCFWSERNEPIYQDYEKIIRLIIKFLKNQFSIKILNLETKIQNIIKTTNFDTLKKVEEKYGFQEKVGHNNNKTY